MATPYPTFCPAVEDSSSSIYVNYPTPYPSSPAAEENSSSVCADYVSLESLRCPQTLPTEFDAQSGYRDTVKPSYSQLSRDSQFHGSFFLLRLPISINGEQCLPKSHQGHLVLEGGNGLYVSFSDIVTSLEKVIDARQRRYGIAKVTNCWCEDAPLFEVLFTSEDGLKCLLDSATDLCLQLSSELKQYIQGIEASQHDGASVDASAEVFLLTPGTKSCKSCRLLIEPVATSNFQESFSLWSTNIQFSFKDAFRRYKFKPGEFARHVGKPLHSCVTAIAKLS